MGVLTVGTAYQAAACTAGERAAEMVRKRRSKEEQTVRTTAVVWIIAGHEIVQNWKRELTVICMPKYKVAGPIRVMTQDMR